MLSTTPIANIKTSKEVEPADIKGSGSPVGGMEPVNMSYCIINFDIKKSKFIALCDYLCFLFTKYFGKNVANPAMQITKRIGSTIIIIFTGL